MGNIGFTELYIYKIDKRRHAFSDLSAWPYGLGRDDNNQPGGWNDMSDKVRHDILAYGQYDMLLRNIICSSATNVEVTVYNMV